MKFSYSIDADRRFIFQHYEGELSLSHLTGCLQRLWADPAYSPSFNGFVDMSSASPRATLDDLQAFIAFVRSRSEHSRGRWAAVTSSPFLTACGMLYQKAMASHHAFAVFSSTEAACSFLQVDDLKPPAAMQAWQTS